MGIECLDNVLWKNSDNKWEYDLNKLIPIIEDISTKFTGKGQLQKYIGVYEDFLNRLEYKHDIKIKYNFITGKHSKNFKAIYQDYNWCYEKYVVEGKTHQEMADELNCSKRVIQKWCVEIHKLHKKTLRKLIELTEVQKQLIEISLLGDGHIDKRDTQPLFIVSHAENQKDYLYWKYDLLKNLCNKPPSVVQGKFKDYNGKYYMCQKQYRVSTKIIDELHDIRIKDKLDIIKGMNEFQLSVFMLDDAYRGDSNWSVCVANFTEEQKKEFLEVCRIKFNLECHIEKDPRYILFNSKSSFKIDRIILDNIPNELDIIKYKILENDKIRCLSNYVYVVDDKGNKVGISQYNKSNYKHIRDELISEGISVITEEDFKKRIVNKY